MSIESMEQSERMRLAAVIEKITNPASETFLSSDAEYLFEALKELAISDFKISASATVSSGGDGPVTNTGTQGDENEKEYSFNVGKTLEFRCGTCVITKTSSDRLEIRRVGDVNAMSNDGEVALLKRCLSGGFELALNKPYILDLPFLPTIVIAGIYKDWKVSKDPENA